MNENFFGYDGPFFTTLNRISDIIILNLLWIVCCIPIITIGASTTALLYVTMKITRGEDAYIVRKFFKSFKENFIQSTLMWLLMLVIGIMLGFNYFFLPNMQGLGNAVYTMIFSASCLTALIYGMILVWLFPLQARLENKIKDTYKNAFLLSFRHLPTTLLLMVIVFVPLYVALFRWFATLFFVWVLFAGSGIAMICSLLYNRIFAIYIKPEGEDGQSDAAQEEPEDEMNWPEE